jgi:hypothetical protein
MSEYDVSEALPAHEYRFRGVRERAEAIAEHQQHRCDEIVRALSEGLTTTWDVAQRLTWSRGWDGTRGFARRAALAETLAHLRYLQTQGEVAVDESGPVLRWTVMGETATSRRRHPA